MTAAALTAAQSADDASAAGPACVVVSAAPAGTVLANWNVPIGSDIRLRYVHSVTRSPVEERYRVETGTLRQTEIRFEEHGPGLPTEADDAVGASWSREDGQFVVRLARAFDSITARVDPAQSPRMIVGGEAVDLAQWGIRSLRLAVAPGRCRDADRSKDNAS